MSDAATVEWLDVAPSDDDKRTLDSWAHARGVTLSAPTEVEVAARPSDSQTARDIEHDLEVARDAVAKLDGRAAEVALSHADRLLREHPELPQGAWLLAEVHRGWAARWSRIDPKSDERATEEWARARALDGGRAAGVGERSFESGERPVAFTLDVELPQGAALFWDGAAVEPGAHQAFEGVHQLRAVASGAVVFASWVSVASGSRVRVAVAGPVACSSADLRAARVAMSTVNATGVRCGSWIAVVRRGPGKLAVGLCERDRCGELLPWSYAPANAAEPLPPSRWPSWKTWAIASGVFVAVGAIVGVALGVSGVFDARSTSTQFVNGGVTPSSGRSGGWQMYMKK